MPPVWSEYPSHSTPPHRGAPSCLERVAGAWILPPHMYSRVDSPMLSTYVLWGIACRALIALPRSQEGGFATPAGTATR